MEKNIDNIKIHYEQTGKGKDVVLLHGWGQNIEMMKPLADGLEDFCRCTIIDLPGFGESSEPLESLSIYEYTEVIEKLLKELNIVNPIIIGHSFGGRIAIIYASRNKTEKIVLFGAPCIREYKPTTKDKILKTLKKIKIATPIVNIMKKKMGSADYNNATPVMRGILVKTVNQDLSEEAKKIECPSLLIWGTNDTAAPIELARRLEKLIKDAGLIEIPGGSHYAYLESLGYCLTILRNFLEDKN